MEKSLDYISGCIQTLEAQQKDPEELVESLGQRLYEILGKISELEQSEKKDLSTETAESELEKEQKLVKSLHQEMLSLMKDMQSCHSAIVKRQAPPHIMNRLEDYQGLSDY